MYACMYISNTHYAHLTSSYCSYRYYFIFLFALVLIALIRDRSPMQGTSSYCSYRYYYILLFALILIVLIRDRSPMQGTSSYCSYYRKTDSIHHHHPEGVVYRGFCLNSGTVAVSKFPLRWWWCIESVFPYYDSDNSNSDNDNNELIMNMIINKW